MKLGSLSSLHESVSRLEEKHLRTQACKEMLLRPRNSMESYCRKLKLNIDDTDPTNYFLCEDPYCSRKKSRNLLSMFRSQRCSCGKLMNRVVSSENLTLENGFVKETATFIICDDLSVLPNVLGMSVDLLRKLGIKDTDAIEEQTVHITKRELSLLSKTPLTDLILEKKPYVGNFKPINQFGVEIGEESSDEGRKIVVKVLIRKSNEKILFAEAEEDFVDLLFSFLTFPLGGVLNMLKGCSSFSCIDKLYKSISEWSPDRYLQSQGLKDKLANPKCAPQFNLNNQILPIGEVCLPVYYCNSYFSSKWFFALTTSTEPPCDFVTKVQLEIVDPKSSSRDLSSHGGFAKGPSMYTVTDDLVVTPMSSISGVSYLNKSKVPLFDLEERVISIGVKEGLGILKASLTSTSALTNGLKKFTKIMKEEI